MIVLTVKMKNCDFQIINYFLTGKEAIEKAYKQHRFSFNQHSFTALAFSSWVQFCKKVTESLRHTYRKNLGNLELVSK